MCDKNYYEIRAGKCPYAQIQNGKIYCSNENCKDSYNYKKINNGSGICDVGDFMHHS